MRERSPASQMPPQTAIAKASEAAGNEPSRMPTAVTWTISITTTTASATRWLTRDSPIPAATL